MVGWIYKKISGMLILLACATHVWSLDQYAGIGTYNNGIFLNYQFGNALGNIEVRAGEFPLVNYNWNINVSARRYIEQDQNVSGFFFGGFAGQVDVKQVGPQDQRILGTGFEMGYQSVSHFSKIELYGDMGVNRRISSGGTTLNSQPMFLLGVSVGLDLNTLLKKHQSGTSH